MNSPRHYNRILAQYASLMEELKRRQAVIDTVLKMRVSVPLIVANELCYLQLRFICELIALACLTVHEDIEASQSGKLRKAYEADWIINRLEKLHPTFYPTPSKQVLNEQGRPTKIVPIETGFLSKQNLISLYRDCGGWLHRGSLKSILSDNPRVPDLEIIRAWNQKIITLLNHHEIQLTDPDTMIWVVMQSKNDGKVHAHLMARADPNTGRPLSEIRK